MNRTIRFSRCPFWLKVGLAVGLALCFGVGSASADPSVIQIGPGTGADPVQLQFTNSVSVLNVKNSVAINSGWFLILGIPLGLNAPDPVPSSSWISQVNGSSNPSGWALDPTHNGPPPAQLSSTTKGSAYDALGLQNIDSSQNWSNWSTADKNINGFTLGGVLPTLTHFDLFVFDINTPIAPKGTDTVLFNNNLGLLPVGTFVFGYGQGADGKFYGSAFTNTGLVTTNSVPNTNPNGGSVPAPSSVVLLGFGGLGFALVLIRSRRRMLVTA